MIEVDMNKMGKDILKKLEGMNIKPKTKLLREQTLIITMLKEETVGREKEIVDHIGDVLSKMKVLMTDIKVLTSREGSKDIVEIILIR